MARVGVLGAGSWGITLANLLDSNGHGVTLWEFDSREAELLKGRRESRDRLPGVSIADSIEITDDLSYSVLRKDVVLFVVPSHVLRDVAQEVARLELANPLGVIATKGLENRTLLRMSEVVRDVVPKMSRVVVLSGPSHAEEVSRNMPTTVVAASEEEEMARQAQILFMTAHFRIYTNRDVMGVELGGALKNVIAIAAGICDGLGLGDNTKGALITRGLAEITRLGVFLGAESRTFSGLSGLGDLVTTCISPHSRNRWVGERIGHGEKLSEILGGMKMVAEGVRTSQSAYQLSRRHGVEMPITLQVYQTLFEEKDPSLAVSQLMTREPKAEIWE